MSKQRLDEHGAPLRPPSRAAANANAGSAECLSCYGAESPEQPCCATCDDLLRAYGNKGWSSAEIKLEAPQCADDRPGSLKETKGERGCRLAGWLEVNKVAGNVHVRAPAREAARARVRRDVFSPPQIAMGESAVQNGRFIHQFDPTKAHAFNVSHVVNELRFGDRYDGMAAPLEGAARYVSPETGTGLFQYFIKLVPTLRAPRAVLGKRNRRRGRSRRRLRQTGSPPRAIAPPSSPDGNAIARVETTPPGTRRRPARSR